MYIFSGFVQRGMLVLWIRCSKAHVDNRRDFPLLPLLFDIVQACDTVTTVINVDVQLMGYFRTYASDP